MIHPEEGAPRALIADDEPNLASYLRDKLAVAWPELEIVGIAGNGPEALKLIEEHDPDVLFLDIRMPGLTGLEVARRVAEGVHVVFVTAYDQYAVEAFDRAATDYLLKPVTDERLTETVRRLKQKLRSPPAANELKSALDALARVLPGVAGTGPERLVWIRASVGNQVRLIAVEDVHERVYRRGRSADSDTAQGALRVARPAALLADPSRHHRESGAGCRDDARSSRTHGHQAQGAT